MTLPVKHIMSTMRGAPVIAGNAPGGLIAAIDALLVTGFGLVTAQAVTVANGIATATLNAGDTFAVDAVVLVAGATPAQLNGESCVLTASNTSITWATTAPDGPATGTITIKVAAAGWEKLYSGTNKACYRSQDPQSAKHVLYVDDSNGLFARVRGFESASDLAVGIGPFPTDPQMSGGGYWHKASASNAVAIPYALIADSRKLLVAVSFGVASSASYTTLELRGFGDPLALNPAGDAYATVLSCGGASFDEFGYGGLAGATKDGDYRGFAVSPRGWQGVGTAVLQRPLPVSGMRDQLSGGCDWFGAAPSGVDGQVKTSPLLLKDQVAGAPARSIIPGALYIPQTGLSTMYAHMSKHDGAGAHAGRRLLALHLGVGVSTVGGVALVDLTGPWRVAE